MTPSERPPILEIVGVYDANGSLGGELAYVWGKWRGTAHCALCAITHGALRRRKGFSELPARLGVPFSLIHRDERAPDVVAFTGGRTPIVIGRTDAGFVDLLVADELAEVETSADGLLAAIRAALEAKGLQIAA